MGGNGTGGNKMGENRLSGVHVELAPRRHLGRNEFRDESQRIENPGRTPVLRLPVFSASRGMEWNGLVERIGESGSDAGSPPSQFFPLSRQMDESERYRLPEMGERDVRVETRTRAASRPGKEKVQGRTWDGRTRVGSWSEAVHSNGSSVFFWAPSARTGSDVEVADAPTRLTVLL